MMSKELSKWRRAMAHHAMELMQLAAEFGDLEQRAAKEKREVIEEWKKVDAALDKDLH
jgi:hypothetical protein